jgi:hypothetical protein
MQTATINFEVEVIVEALDRHAEAEITEIGLIVYDPSRPVGLRHKTTRMVPVSPELSKLILEHFLSEAEEALAEADTDHAESAAEYRWEMASGR